MNDHMEGKNDFYSGLDIVEKHELTPAHAVVVLHQRIPIGLAAISTCPAFLLKSYRNNQIVFPLILKQKLRKLALS